MTLLFYFIKSTIMNKVIILAGLLCCMHTLYAQNTPAKKDTIRKEISLEEVVISASNFAEKKRNIAQKIDVINAATIAATNAQNTGDLLINTAGASASSMPPVTSHRNCVAPCCATC